MIFDVTYEILNTKRCMKMFTKIKLQNFRTFDNIEFDLSLKSGSPKNLAIVYGENGVGKSNLVSAFVLLCELMATMDVRDMYEELLTQKSIFSDERLEQDIRQRIVESIRDMRAIINDCRMVNCDGPIIAEYEFNISGNSGKYHIELGENEIIHERLEYLLNKRRGVYFDCSKEAIVINNSVVKDKDLLLDIRATAKRFWGKHSLLAIICHELYDKSEAYGKDNISANFDDVLGELGVLSCSIGFGTRKWDKLYAPLDVFENATYGRILKDKENQLDLAECIFSQFFSAINPDIRKVEYDKMYNGKYINYRLMVEKMIAGEYREIDFARESAGNHQVLRVLCYFLTACMGGIVVLDEADSGIHDMLFQKMLQEVHNFISGQVIMTTHNTMLMETDFAREATYILYEESAGHKLVRCITDYEDRTYISNNIRSKYLNKKYQGIPNIEKIDFGSLIKTIASGVMDDK